MLKILFVGKKSQELNCSHLSRLLKESLLVRIIDEGRKKYCVQNHAFKIVIYVLPTCFPGVILTCPLLLWVLRMALSACSCCYSELSASGNLHHEEHKLMSFLLFIFFHLEMHETIFVVANTLFPPCSAFTCWSGH